MPSASLIAESNKRRSGKAWFFLYDIELETDATASRWVLLTSHDQDVTYRGRTYHAYPIRHDRIPHRAGSDLSSISLTVSNLHGLAEQYLRAYDGLEGRRVRIRRVHEDLLSADVDTIPHDFTIKSAKPTLAVLACELGEAPLHEVSFPSRHFARDQCGYLFRDGRCGWVAAKGGDASACDYTLDGANGCVAHGNEERFGGFASAPEAL